MRAVPELELLRRSGMAVMVALNKSDLIDPERAREVAGSYQELCNGAAGAATEATPHPLDQGPGAGSGGTAATAAAGSDPATPPPAPLGEGSAWPLHPVSALQGEGCEALVAAMVAALPQGPMLYPADAVSDQPEQLLLAELIREQVLHHTREEVPHAVAVQIERIVEDGPRTAVLATVLVERASQKGILIGRGGSMLRTIGQGARLQMQKLFDGPVYLELFVKVVPGWRSHPGRLAELGYRGD
jgi:GTP-binding protein Era